MISSCLCSLERASCFWKGTWKKQDGRRAAQDTLTTAELPAGTLPVPTAGESAARRGSALGTWALGDPVGQSCPKNRLCSSWTNIKCHFHANFQAWTQVFVFQGMVQKASAFCTDGYSQDLENNPPELMRLDFLPYEIIVSVILLNIKGYS